MNKHIQSLFLYSDSANSDITQQKIIMNPLPALKVSTGYETINFKLGVIVTKVIEGAQLQAEFYRSDEIKIEKNDYQNIPDESYIENEDTHMFFEFSVNADLKGFGNYIMEVEVVHNENIIEISRIIVPVKRSDMSSE